MREIELEEDILGKMEMEWQDGEGIEIKRMCQKWKEDRQWRMSPTC